MSKKIFLDFDDVLFNTRLFTESLQEVYQEFGISTELFQKTYQEAKQEYGDQWLGYSSQVHIPKLQKYCTAEASVLRDVMDTFLEDTRQFLFPDVREFLFWCQEQGYEVNILSYGDRDFQAKKIQGSQLSEYTKECIVTEKEKGEALVRAVGSTSAELWFFDDRLRFLEEVKRALPEVHTVLVARPEGRYTEERNQFCEYQVSSLMEGKEVLEKFSTKS